MRRAGIKRKVKRRLDVVIVVGMMEKMLECIMSHNVGND
jgi:hypothetical protein